MLITAEQVAKQIGKSAGVARKLLADFQPAQELSLGKGKMRLYDASVVPQVQIAAAARAAANTERLRQHGQQMYTSGKFKPGRRQPRLHVGVDRIAALERKLDALLRYFQISEGNGHDEAPF